MYLSILSVLLLLINLFLLFQLYRRGAVGDTAPIEMRLSSFEKGLDRIERALREESGYNRTEAATHAKQLREEVHSNIMGVSKSISERMTDISTLQKNQLEAFSTNLTTLTQGNERRLELIRGVIDTQLQKLQQDNAEKLEQMRQTVDEKLQGTLEKRLGESFRLVSERLEQVHKGLGEMQLLAHGVGDLKKVLSNVKIRGNWGEVQLGNLLEQLLTPDQYAANVKTNPSSSEVVEYAIKLPGKGEKEDKVVWLPIDAKFPQEDYLRLIEAHEKADLEGAELASKKLEQRIKQCAQDICTKYLCPPDTTDFGIMFLPTEGLYAEVIRRTGLVEVIQRDCRVIMAGPTTLAALLNSLQMGFRTLAIQKRSSEVWAVLGAVKTEFGKFGGVIDKVKKKLEEASNVVDDVQVRTRAVERKLRHVQELPSSLPVSLLEEVALLESDIDEDSK